MAEKAHVDLAASLLEVESLVMNSRAHALLKNQEEFLKSLLSARSKLGAVVAALLAHQGENLSELFLAVPTDDPSPVAAVDPVAGGATE